MSARPRRFSLAATIVCCAVGCGNPDPTPGPLKDAGGADLPLPDLARGIDIQDQPVAPTGADCQRDSDCSSGAGPRQKGVCRLKTGTATAPLPWPGGYCTSDCRAGRDDDCPGAASGEVSAICDGTTLRCELACQDHAVDCRDGYACANIGSARALCLPAAASGCDPAPSAKVTCPMAQVCVSYSPDDSYGQCAPTCDVYSQGCADAGGQPQACVADVQSGAGSCVGYTEGNGNGADCVFLNGCDRGLACHVEGPKRYCRPYCGGPGNVACPMGLTCKPLTAGSMVPLTTIGICGG